MEGEDITRQLTIGREFADGRSEHKTIHPLGEGELARYRSLGRGSGVGAGHVLYEAFLHCRDFYERVAAYRLVRSEETEALEKGVGRPYLTIEFYERIPS